MRYAIKTGPAVEHASDCLVAGIFKGPEMSPTAREIDKATHGRITELLQSGDMEGKSGQSLMLYDLAGITSKRVLLIGCGKANKFDGSKYRSTVGRAASLLNKTGSRNVSFCLAELDVKQRDSIWKVRHAAEAIGDTLYSFQQLKSKPEEIQRPLQTATLFITDDSDLDAAQNAITTGSAIVAGTALAKDLGNLPGNICTPPYLAEAARKLADNYGMKLHILEEADMEKLGMGALLSVAHGSRQPAKLITLEYQGGKKNDPPVALVGKGLTFDAGGISLKPSANMDEMKYDMCGGASVLGTLKAVGELKLPVNVVGIIPSSENLPDGAANKPGDIVTSMSGQTIEVLNTDAEGRLILCDALTYSERFQPIAVIDIATLTGACVVSLGGHASGLMGNDETLVNALLNAGDRAHDRAWQLPLWDEYQKQLDSNFADMANVGGRPAGTITAGCFLSRFAKELKWAHLDIAGTAWKTGKEKGATGRPVALLTQFFMDRSAEK